MSDVTLKERGRVEEVDADFSTSIRNGLRLDLGCGERKADGFQGVDDSALPGVDYVVDLMSPDSWPWEEESVLELRASHFVEHLGEVLWIEDGRIKRKNGLNHFMEQAWRVMRPDGLLTVIAPYYTSIRATQDPTHVRFINEITFSYYNQPTLQREKLTHYLPKADFDIASIRFAYHPEWETRADEVREWNRVHSNNVVADIIIELRCVKPGRFPVL